MSRADHDAFLDRAGPFGQQPHGSSQPDHGDLGWGTITLSLTASTGRRFFIEIVKGRVRRTNARDLAAAYLQ